MSKNIRRARLTSRLERLEERDVPAVIGGIVYNDANANGLFDLNEPVLSNVTVQLQDQQGNLIATTTTDATGRYTFTERDNVSTAPGQSTFEAVFASAPTNQNRSAALQMFDPELGTLTSVEIIAEGGLDSLAKVENLSPGATQVQTKVNGIMSFTVQGLSNVISATINRQVTDNVPAFDGVADLLGPSTKDFGTIQANGQFQSITLSDPAALQAFVGNGTLQVTQDASADVCACSDAGNLMAAIQTTASGKVKVVYHYTPSREIGPGTYRVVETQPNGYIDGRETKDNLTAIVGSEHTDVIEVVVVNRNDQSISNHFGELRPSSLSGVVYHDRNRNGARDGNDTGIPGVTMTLTGIDVFGNAVSHSTLTGAGGGYSFSGLMAGTYTIIETQPAGYQQGTNRVGNLGGTLAGDTITVDVGEGQNGTNYDFGEVTNAIVPPPPIIQVPPTRFIGKFFFTGGWRMWL